MEVSVKDGDEEGSNLSAGVGEPGYVSTWALDNDD